MDWGYEKCAQNITQKACREEASWGMYLQMEANIKTYIKHTLWKCGLNSCGPGDGLMTGCFNRGNERKDSMKERWDILTR